MNSATKFEIFLGTQPGLERVLRDEAIEAGYKKAKTVNGGVTFWGDWSDVWRANLTLRGPSKVLARIGTIRAFHLAQLDKRARKFAWGNTIPPGLRVRVEVVTSQKSKIYHAGAAAERIERAMAEDHGVIIAKDADDAQIVIKARIDDNNVILSVDTSGAGLHKRGHKQAMGKAPLRETMAALLLRACEYNGTEPVLDPMCGSGTFIIEAAEIAAGFMAGRSRRFAFEQLATFDAAQVAQIRRDWQEAHPAPSKLQGFYGSDRNEKVIGFAKQNARRAGIEQFCTFAPLAISSVKPPAGPPGLVMVNPPYGSRIGNKKELFSLYHAFGEVMRDRFSGWRIGMVTSDTMLAESTKLPWLPTNAPIAHGGLKVKLFQTGPL
ncbi:THUMP domain-containing class I SAM-dependent RNA methyltransferase [Robiginitomaculum antarcticum]|uniref:THUMP domain-containing class I SAM-dependent RNA methyltransferase n=1 Tax=Robiginitomaculum antarcticum TaxID=437507 RepID=UPI0003A20975|nr:RNA methyltransferase [Robiginitomaculum antarcticum]